MFHPAPVSLGLSALPAAWAERAHPRARRAEAADLNRYFCAGGHHDSVPAWPVVVQPAWRQRLAAWYHRVRLPALSSFWREFLCRG